MLCPRSPSIQEPIYPSQEPCVRQCLWPRARRQARPRSARRSDASRRQRGRCLAPLPSRALGSAPAAPREPGRTPRLVLLSLGPPSHPNPNSTSPHRRAHPDSSWPPPLSVPPNLHPTPSGRARIVARETAPPPVSRDTASTSQGLQRLAGRARSSRLLPLHQLLGTHGRQGTRGTFLIGWRGRRLAPPTPAARSASGLSGRRLASALESGVCFQNFSRPYLPFILSRLFEESQGPGDTQPSYPGLPHTSFPSTFVSPTRF